VSKKPWVDEQLKDPEFCILHGMEGLKLRIEEVEAERNQYKEVIERIHTTSLTHSTIWEWCDEVLEENHKMEKIPEPATKCPRCGAIWCDERSARS